MVPPQGSKTTQGYELQLGTNCLAPFLFTHFLRPVLIETAKTAPPNTVRVVWVSSSAAEFAPKPPIDFSNMDYHIDEGIWSKYMRSKAGNVLHAAEFARRVKSEGVISLSLNPGNLKTDLTKTTPWLQKAALSLILHEPINGAYTELFAGLNASITDKNNGGWIAPSGRIESDRKS